MSSGGHKNKKKRICVIGTGASGLTAVKACLEGGLEVVAYDKTDYLGGLWQYHEENTLASVASVARSTIINTSKELSAFSDFPPPEDFPNFMRNDKMIQYFQLYAQKFGVDKHLKLAHEVLKVELVQDSPPEAAAAAAAAPPKWRVRVRDLKHDNAETESLFDGVMVATGHHTTPHEVSFPGQEAFRGRVVHSHAYKRPGGYEDKRVVVVGVGNSGCDAAVEICNVASQVYLSTRRGTWVMNRVGDRGAPVDVASQSRLLNVLISRWPRLANAIVEYKLNGRFDHGRYQLRPRHHFFSAHFTINDRLPNCILSGTVQVKGGLQRFTPDGVIFEGDGGRETPVDIVVLATGYRIGFPFLDRSVVDPESNAVQLYKNVFSPRLPAAAASTLGFIGFIQPTGAIFPISEMQARWYVACMTGRCSLPDRPAMERDLAEYTRWLNDRYYASPRHTIQVLYVDYLDEVANFIGARPDLWKILREDPRLGLKLIFGPAVAYQWRLVGPDQWDGAREAILSVSRRVQKPLNTKNKAACEAADTAASDRMRSALVYAAAAVLFMMFLTMIWN